MDNNRFLRFWYEVGYNNTCLEASSATEAKTSEKKWIAYNKGGSFRRWYGNRDYTINWYNDGKELKTDKNA